MLDLFMVFIDRYFFIYTVFPWFFNSPGLGTLVQNRGAFEMVHVHVLPHCIGSYFGENIFMHWVELGQFH